MSEEFSVKDAVLYRIGVGFFSAESEMDNADTIYFPVPSADLDDFLKTSLIGIKGGEAAIKNLSFETKGVSKTLFSTSNVLMGMLNFFRGKHLSIKYSGSEVSGKLLGYQQISGEDPILKVSVLTKEAVVKHIDGLKIDEIIPTSEKDQSQLNDFLASLANESDDEAQTLLKIQLNNTGDFTVKVSFLTSIPAWKLTYRMQIMKEDMLGLETFGIVDNNTLVDWIDARLVLSTKNPVSFMYDLSTPHKISRPRIERVSDTGIAPPAPKPAAPTTGAGFTRGLKAKMQVPAMAMEQAFYDEDEEEFDDDFGYAIEEQASVELGESIEYRLKQPVTIKRKQSSMVPLSTSEFAGRRKWYFNERNHDRHPFFVVEFTNELDHALENGPISIYDNTSTGSIFLGEAMLPRIGKGEDFLLSYALDKNISVKYSTNSWSYLERTQVRELAKRETYTQIKSYSFEVTNRGQEDADMYLAVRKNHYKALENEYRKHKQTVEYVEVSDEFRVKVLSKSSETTKLDFIVFSESVSSNYLYYMGQSALEELLDNPDLSEEEREVIRVIYNLSKELDDLRREKENVNQKYSRSKDRRDQIIQTLGVLDKDSEDQTRKKYISEIEEIDGQITTYLEKMEELDTKINDLEIKRSNYDHVDQMRNKIGKRMKK